MPQKKPFLHLQGRVDPKMRSEMERRIEQLSINGSPHFELFISSDGGDFHDGMRIAEMIQDYAGCVTGTVVRYAASAAVSILLMCDVRRATRSSILLAHNVRVEIPSEIFRNKHKLAQTVQDALAAADFVEDMYADKLKMSKRRVRAFLREDRTLTAKEALELGIIHEILKR